jgi:N-acetylneuraminic acid mutarotase
MKSKLLFLLLICVGVGNVSAQWTQRASFTGTARAKSTSFTIGDKIYVLGGVDANGSVIGGFFAYDIPTNTWSQLPAFPGPDRYGATAFVLNNKGYVATGGNDFGYLDDLWQYDPVAGTWQQKTGLPALSVQHENQRREAYSFVINGRAYLGGGDGWVFGPNSTTNYAFIDLWEYNPLNDHWTQKADVPDFGKDLSIGVAVNGKGYVGLGCDVSQTVNRQSFWEYDPITNSWAPKTDFPSPASTDCSAFVLDSTIYVVGGVKLTPVALSSQVYKYDVPTDTWTQIASFNGGSIAGAFTACNGSSAFVGTGYNSNIVPVNKVWEFSLPTNVNDGNVAHAAHALVYPNPASEFISINSEEKISNLEIIDLTGKIISSVMNDFSRINLSEFASGVYTIKVKYKDGKVDYDRLVKQ